jgi:hypothetical protein
VWEGKHSYIKYVLWGGNTSEWKMEKRKEKNQISCLFICGRLRPLYIFGLMYISLKLCIFSTILCKTHSKFMLQNGILFISHSNCYFTLENLKTIHFYTEQLVQILSRVINQKYLCYCTKMSMRNGTHFKNHNYWIHSTALIDFIVNLTTSSYCLELKLSIYSLWRHQME